MSILLPDIVGRCRARALYYVLYLPAVKSAFARDKIPFDAPQAVCFRHMPSAVLHLLSTAKMLARRVNNSSCQIYSDTKYTILEKKP